MGRRQKNGRGREHRQDAFHSTLLMFLHDNPKHRGRAAQVTPASTARPGPADSGGATGRARGIPRSKDACAGPVTGEPETGGQDVLDRRGHR